MARLTQQNTSSGKRILLVDDQEDYRIATHSLLSRQGHEVVTACDGWEALSILRQQYIDLVLLDYFMPGGQNGEQVVAEIRKFNPYIQIILQTGYSGEYPPREMMRRLDIQGYHDKTDGPEKLLLWVDVGLKAAYVMNILHHSRQSLRYILDVTPELHKIQTLEHLLQGILLQITGLLGTANSFLAVVPGEKNPLQKPAKSDAFLAMLEEESHLQINVATGKFSNQHSLESCLDAAKITAINEILQKTEIKFGVDYTILPLVVGKVVLGVIFLDHPLHNQHDVEILQIFANQAAVAIQNTRLYAIATNDQLTGVYVRNFFEQCLLRELHICLRQQLPLSIMMIDLDRLKQINDTAGHVAGDAALAIMGKVIRSVTRSTDLAGRYGGDEFIILFPNTPLKSVHLAAERIMADLSVEQIEGAWGAFPVKCSIGACGMAAYESATVKMVQPLPNSYYQNVANQLIGEADQLLYQAKQNGRSCFVIGSNLQWPNYKANH